MVEIRLASNAVDGAFWMGSGRGEQIREEKCLRREPTNGIGGRQTSGARKLYLASIRSEELMRQIQRHDRIIKLEDLLYSQAMTMAELVDVLKVSSATIRRDLEFLRRTGSPFRFRRSLGWYWHRTDSRHRVTVEEAEANHRIEDDDPEYIEQFPELLLPFGFLNQRWKALLAKMHPGDELWECCSDAKSWENLAGWKGIELVRNGKIIDRITTSMN